MVAASSLVDINIDSDKPLATDSFPNTALGVRWNFLGATSNYWVFLVVLCCLCCVYLGWSYIDSTLR